MVLNNFLYGDQSSNPQPAFAISLLQIRGMIHDFPSMGVRIHTATHRMDASGETEGTTEGTTERAVGMSTSKEPESGRLVSWILTYDFGELGMLYTDPVSQRE